MTCNLPTVWRIVRSVASAAGYKQEDVDRFTSPHALRHWFAQNLRDDLVPLDVIQAGLGHSNLETTREIYAPFPNLKPMVDSLNRLLPRGNGPNDESDAK
ncbi:MAG: site-specific integrase [Chloroflexi bacterium]|nr:site-specific integrase [Chloroflexota bacterium]